MRKPSHKNMFRLNTLLARTGSSLALRSIRLFSGLSACPALFSVQALVQRWWSLCSIVIIYWLLYYPCTTWDELWLTLAGKHLELLMRSCEYVCVRSSYNTNALPFNTCKSKRHMHTEPTEIQKSINYDYTRWWTALCTSSNSKYSDWCDHALSTTQHMGPTNEMCNLCVHARMTPWTFRVNTPGAAGVLTRNVVLHLFSVGFPHVSVGGIVGNHWRLSSARSLFQRAIEPCEGLVISKDTRCLLQHIPPMAKRIPCQAACFSSQCACPALPIFPMVGRNPFSRRLTRARPSVKL